MKENKNIDWQRVITRMKELAAYSVKNDGHSKSIWTFGQEDTISWVAEQFTKPGRNGVLVADEVGMGKTRVVMAAILAVVENGGNVAAVVPPGLLFQWQKEWEDFIKSLNNNSASKTIEPILLRSFWNLFENDLEYPLSCNKNKWLLMSHQFGPPQRLGKSTSVSSFMLPILAKALINNNKKNSYWQAIKKHINEIYRCLGNDCRTCHDNHDCDIWYHQLNKAAMFLSKPVYKHLFNNVPESGLETGKSKVEFADWFNNGGLQMIGKLLGNYDLIIIDEAHKNRSETGRLDRVLNKIIITNSSAKYISMTATPMELQPDDWEKLFERIHEEANYPQDIINEFEIFRKQFNLNPDNEDSLKKIKEASHKYTRALSPYITRRVRLKQKEMIDLLQQLPKDEKNKAHPHREYKPIEISIDNVTPQWKNSIFSFEAIGKSAKGFKTSDKELDKLLRQYKVTDSRYAAGQIKEPNDSGENFDEDKLGALLNKLCTSTKGAEEKIDFAKLKRIQYWRKSFEHKSNLLEHPRIRQVADEIENELWVNNNKLSPEKILVFGTFIKPIEALNNVINFRALLKLLDSNNSKNTAIPAYSSFLSKTKQIWSEYYWLKSENRLNRNYKSESDIADAITRGGNIYTQYRQKLSKVINEEFVRKRLNNVKDINFNSIEKLLRDRLINEIICNGNDLERISSEQLRKRAIEFWNEYRDSYFEVSSEDFEIDGNDIRYFQQMLDNEKEHLDGNISFFSRLLYGKVSDMKTRRVIQSQFNNGHSFPRVLIAQSQVGREGLNLHKACRYIIQLHSEWNPGVIEQQIGRVDRINSYWEDLARNYNKIKNGSNDAFPKIIIRPVIFEGTYDNFQYQVSKSRRETLNAHLFGDLVSEDALEIIKSSQDSEKILNELSTVAPDFSPR